MSGDGVQAELHGKTRPPTEAWEDTLTDVVFSAFRWLPPASALADFWEIATGNRPSGAALSSVAFHFWPRLRDRAGGACEPDVIMRISDEIVVIEAKAGAAFSGSVSAGTHQLLREARAAAERWPKCRLYLVALTRDFAAPDDVRDLEPLLSLSGATIRWMSWSDIARIFESQDPQLGPHHHALIGDVLAFMRRRKVASLFTGFDERAYLEVVSATQRAREDIYPAMAQLADELREHFERAGWTWRNGGGRRVFGHWTSSDWTQPQRWGRTYMALLWWPPTWAQQKGWTGWVGVVCNFLEPYLDVVYAQPGGTAVRNAGVVEELVSRVHRLSDDLEVSFFSNSQWGDGRASAPVAEVDAAWLVEHLGARRFRVRRRIPVAAVRSSAEISSAIEAFAADVEAAGLPAFFSELTHAAEEPAPHDGFDTEP